jgi:hypothetical protein
VPMKRTTVKRARNRSTACVATLAPVRDAAQ